MIWQKKRCVQGIFRETRYLIWFHEIFLYRKKNADFAHTKSTQHGGNTKQSTPQNLSLFFCETNTIKLAPFVLLLFSAFSSKGAAHPKLHKMALITNLKLKEDIAS